MATATVSVPLSGSVSSTLSLYDFNTSFILFVEDENTTSGNPFLWVSSATANNGTIYAGLTGFWKMMYDGPVNVKWFGATGDFDVLDPMNPDHDDLPAIQAAIDYCASSNICKSIFFPAGQYLVTAPINLSSNSSIDRSFLRLFGESQPDLRGTLSSSIHACSSLDISATAIVESIGSDSIEYENLNFLSEVNWLPRSFYPTVGIFQSRGIEGVDQRWGGRHHYKNVTITVLVLPTFVSEIGGIGLMLLDAEESTFENIEVWSSLNLAILNLNEISIYEVDSNGVPTSRLSPFTYVPYYSTIDPISAAVSNTVFSFIGECRFISFDRKAPNVYINSASDVDLGHSFLQRNGIIGTYDFAFQIDNIFGFKWGGTAEDTRGLLLLIGSAYNMFINSILGNQSSQPIPLIYYIVQIVSYRDFQNNEIVLRLSDPTQRLLTSVNSDGSDAAHILKVSNAKFKTNLQPSSASPSSNGDYYYVSLSPRFLYRSQNVVIEYLDKSFVFNKNVVETNISVKDLNTTSAVTILRAYFPVAPSATSGSMTLIFEGNLFTGGTDQSTNPSMLAFQASVNIGNSNVNPNNFQTNSSVSIIGSPLNIASGSPSNNLTGLTLNQIVFASIYGILEVQATVSGSGADINNCVLVGKVKLFHSLGFNTAPGMDPVFNYGVV